MPPWPWHKTTGNWLASLYIRCICIDCRSDVSLWRFSSIVHGGHLKRCSWQWRRVCSKYNLGGPAWALRPLHGSPWVLKYLYCHQMITQTHPREDKRVLEKVKL